MSLSFGQRAEGTKDDGDEGLTGDPAPRITYTLDFLKSLRDNPNSVQRPPGIPNEIFRPYQPVVTDAQNGDRRKSKRKQR